MLKFLQYIKEELLIEGANLHGKVGADGKALGHVRDYVMPLLSAGGRAKTAKALAKVGGVKGDTDVHGHMHDPKATSTHVLASKYNGHQAGTPVNVTHVSSGGEDGRNLFAHTESHGKVPLSKLAKPAALKKAPKTEGGFDIEKKLSTHLGTKAAGSSATGYDFHYKGASTAEKPAVRGSVKTVEQKEQKKSVKGIDRPDVRGESKLMKGKFGQSVVSFEKGKGWGFRNSSKMNPALQKATVTGTDGKERDLIDHLNRHHPDGVIDRGFTARAARGTARHYLNSSNVNTLHVHNRQIDKKTGKVKVDRGTTYTIGKTSLKGKTNLSHLTDRHIDRLDGSVNILSTRTGRAEVTHRPSQSVMREYADNSHNSPDQHRDLTNPNHAAEFKTHVDRHIAEYKKTKK
jgi:hypothetical protein